MQSIRAGWFATRIAIDGRLTEGEWESADVIDDFRQTDPSEGAALSAHPRAGAGRHARDDHRHRLRRPPDRGSVVQRPARRRTRLLRITCGSCSGRSRTAGRDTCLRSTRAGRATTALINPGGESDNADWDGIWEAATARTADRLERRDPHSGADARLQARPARVALQRAAANPAPARNRSVGVAEPSVSDDADQPGRAADRICPISISASA